MLVKNFNYMVLLFLDTTHLVFIACIAGNISPLLVTNGITDTVSCM